MTTTLKCDCDHLGNCPFQSGASTVDLAGQPLYRTLEVPRKVDSEFLVQEVADAGIPRGALVGSTSDGQVYIVAEAIDPDKSVEYAASKLGKTCKADGFWWRTRNPPPRV